MEDKDNAYLNSIADLSDDIDASIENLSFRHTLEENILKLRKAITKNIGLYVVTEQRKEVKNGTEVLGDPMFYIRTEKGKKLLYDLVQDTMSIVCSYADNDELNSIKNELCDVLDNGAHDTYVLAKRVKRLIKAAEDLLHLL